MSKYLIGKHSADDIKDIIKDSKKNSPYDPKIARIWDEYLMEIPYNQIYDNAKLFGALTKPSITIPYSNTGLEYIFFENSSVFSPRAEEFRITGGYATNLIYGTKSYKDYWIEERNRVLNGYTVGGFWIPGEYYFYLNYCPIKRVIDYKSGKEGLDFPLFTSMDYYWFMQVNNAENATDASLKQNLLAAKSRRMGFSFKNAAGICHKFFFFKESMCVIVSEFEDKAKNTLNMCYNIIDFINQHTEFRTPLLTRTKSRVVAGAKVFENGKEYIKGKKSEILTVTLHNKPDAAAGYSAIRVVFEEAGMISMFKEAWAFTEPTLRSGALRKGIAIAYGCVCAGTKIFTNNGKVINVEDLRWSDGLIGYNGEQASPQEINWFKEPSFKNCYRITTDSGQTIECSDDHPLLITRKNLFSYKNKTTIKKAIYQEAKHIKVNDQIILPSKVDVFGSEDIPYAREIGLLIGDGNYSKNQTPTLSCSENEIFQYLRNSYGYLSSTKNYSISESREYSQILLKALKPLLIKHGIYGQTKDKKRLPVDIHTFNKESVANLLAGYFDADGNVYYNKKKNIVRIVLSSVVKELLEQVRFQLLKFGIHPTIVKENRKVSTDAKYSGQKDYIYRLYINQQQDIKTFSDNIILLNEEKRNKLSKIKESKYKVFNAKFEVNPLNNKEGYFDSYNLQDLRYTTVTKVEDIGEQKVYNLNCGPNHNYLSNGFITRQTGGDMLGSTRDFAEMFYSPSAYGFKEYNNIYEDTSPQCGYFIPNMAWKEGSKVTIEGNTYQAVDQQGNSKYWVAELALNIERANATKGDRRSLYKTITQYPKTPKEAFLTQQGDIFPVSELLEVSSSLRKKYHNAKAYTAGKLIETESGIQFMPDIAQELYPLDYYPLNGKESASMLRGAVMVYEQPKSINGVIPHDAYIIGFDPYRVEGGVSEVTSETSLGAAYVMRTNKYSKEMEGPSRIVASYIAREDLSDDYYYNLYKLALFYNCKIMYENEVGNVKQYFQNKKALHLLAPTPIHAVEKFIPNANTSMRRYGFSTANQKYKREYIRYVIDWLLEKRPEDPELINMHLIPDSALIDEMIMFNFEYGNFDRISALIGCILHMENENLTYAYSNTNGNKATDFFIYNSNVFNLNKLNSMKKSHNDSQLKNNLESSNNEP